MKLCGLSRAATRRPPPWSAPSPPCRWVASSSSSSAPPPPTAEQFLNSIKNLPVVSTKARRGLVTPMTAATTPTMAATADHGTGRRATIRQRRVAKIIEDQLTVLIGNERHHPKLPFGALPQVTMLAVEVSPDLREATVWWEPDEFSSRSTHDLEPRVLKAANATRAALAKRISLRYVPILKFRRVRETPEEHIAAPWLAL